MEAKEQRSTGYRLEGATTLIVACNTPARMAKAAVERLRREGRRVGLFQPLSLWPFPIKDLMVLLKVARRVVVVEASDGQLEDEMRLALHHARGPDIDIRHLRHMGGILPTDQEIYEIAKSCTEVAR